MNELKFQNIVQFGLEFIHKNFMSKADSFIGIIDRIENLGFLGSTVFFERWITNEIPLFLLEASVNSHTLIWTFADFLVLVE